MGIKDAIRRILGVEKRLKDRPKMLKVVGSILVASVQRNFEVGGRPEKWKATSEVTNKRTKGGSTLRRQGMAGGLMGSIHAKVEGDEVHVGTNKIYGAVHQFGAKRGEFGTVTAKVGAHTRSTKKHGVLAVKAHTRQQKVPWGDIPARPFLLVQDEDQENIRLTLGDYFLKGKGE